MNINKTRIKAEKKKLALNLDAILAKYNFDDLNGSLAQLSDSDFNLYIALDSTISLFSEILSSTSDVLIIENRIKEL
jgi:hypothetical protein